MVASQGNTVRMLSVSVKPPDADKLTNVLWLKLYCRRVVTFTCDELRFMIQSRVRSKSKAKTSIFKKTCFIFTYLL